MDLSVEIITQVDSEIKKGLTREAALKAAGVPQAIYRQWLAWGQEGKSPYDTFLVGMEQAEAAAEAAGVLKLKDAPAWQATAWWLERRFPEKWGQKIQLELKQELDHTLNIAQAVLEPSQYEKLLVALSAKQKP
jgi:transposase